MSLSAASNHPPKPDRNDTIDLLRIVAACGVIWFHLDSTPFKRVGYAGLVFFLIVSVVFQKGSAEKATISGFLGKRTMRLMLPWAAWFVIYGALNLLIGKRLFPYTFGFWENVFCGPWIGLWYLPFSFVSACLVYALVHPARTLRPLLIFVAYAVVSFGALLAVAYARSLGAYVNPWAQWLQAAPSLPVGLAMAYAHGSFSRSRQMVLAYEVVLLGLCAAIYDLDPGLAISYGLGSAMVIAGLLLKRQLSPRIASISISCLGVYLIHGCVMSGLKIIPWVTQNYLCWFFLTTLISFVAVGLIRKTPYVKEIV